MTFAFWFVELALLGYRHVLCATVRVGGVGIQYAADLCLNVAATYTRWSKA